MKFPLHGCVTILALTGLLAGCGGTPRKAAPEDEAAARALIDAASATSVLGPDSQFAGSPLPDVGLSGLFRPRAPEDCQVDVLAGGEDSFALRMASLKAAKKSIRIQALVFVGDEAGLRIAEVLKQKKAQGLDVRIIVDAFSNPWLQTQWMFFDLKQNGIEVEGYEAMALQWLNEVQIPKLTPHYDAQNPDRRFHEKMWIIDGETDEGIAVTGGLNIGNPYFRVDPADPDANWRDQDVAVKGRVLTDLVAAFDRNFQYFVDVKKSRGIFNTNKYWDATRSVMNRTGKLPIHYSTKPERVARVAQMEAHEVTPHFRGATCRFFQSRPRLQESYIHQAYIKLIERAKREVLIANAYFVPTPSISAALQDAARRCVAVKLISNSPDTNDLPEISMVGRGYYKTLLAVNQTPEVAACKNTDAGIRIWEWVGKSSAESVAKQGTMHSKFAVIDGRRSLVGSYNLDPRSEKLNSETALVFDEPSLSQRLRRQFLDSDLQFSAEVTPERAAQFENPDKVIERFRKSIGDFFQNQL